MTTPADRRHASPDDDSRAEGGHGPPTELVSTRSHVTQLIDSHEVLKAAHDALNLAAQGALADKERKMQESESLPGTYLMIFRQQFDLLDAKELKQVKFRGRATEHFKPWQRKGTSFCQSKRTGFRAALEWAETHSTEILNATVVPWDDVEAAAAKLQDFLFQILNGNALLLIDKPALNEGIWESWRLLV